jgi:hypothetical protein
VLKESLMDGANVRQHGLLRKMEFRGNNICTAPSQSFLINQVVLTHPIDKDLAVPTREPSPDTLSGDRRALNGLDLVDIMGASGKHPDRWGLPTEVTPPTRRQFRVIAKVFELAEIHQDASSLLNVRSIQIPGWNA